MEFKFVGQKVDLTDSLKQYAQKRVSKLEKYFPEREDQEIEARVKMNIQAERQIAEIQINGNGNFFEGKAETPDLYASIDGAVEKLGRQLRSFHDRMTNHRKKNNEKLNQKMASRVFRLDEEEQDDGEAVTIERQTFTAKPMSTEEAVLQMESRDFNFFVFTNHITEDINVVYKRDDGTYGLIEAES
jgi:putative sigma-54 modulation protein